MNPSAVSWQSYEDVARYILKELRAHLGVSDVTGYIDLRGQSGTHWRVEGKIHKVNQDGFLIMECRRRTTKGVTQEEIGGLAFRIRDTGARGAVLVSPLPLQKGAALVANSASIEHIKIASWSTSEDYLATILGKNFHRASIAESATLTDEVSETILRNGKVVP